MRTHLEEHPRPSLGAVSWEGPLPASPWTASDLNRLLLTTLLGGGLILASWLGAANTPVVTRTIAWGSLGVAGIVFTIAAMTMWLLQAFRGVRLASTTALRIGHDMLAPSAVAAPAAGRVAGLVTAPELSYVHDSTCLLVKGKDVHAAAAGELPDCPVCLS